MLCLHSVQNIFSSVEEIPVCHAEARGWTFPDIAGQLVFREAEAICQHLSWTLNETKNI